MMDIIRFLKESPVLEYDDDNDTIRLKENATQVLNLAIDRSNN